MSSRDLLPDHPAELTLLEYLVGDLPDETSDRIRRHVAACRACRRTIADLSMTVDELDRLPTVHRPHEAPVPLEELPGPRPFRAARILTIVAVLVAAVGVAVVLRLNEPSGPPPRTTRFFLRLPARPAAVEIAIRDALPATAQPRVSFTQGKPVSVVVNVAKGDLDATLRDLPQMPPTRNGRYWTVDVGVVERDVPAAAAGAGRRPRRNPVAAVGRPPSRLAWPGRSSWSTPRPRTRSSRSAVVRRGRGAPVRAPDRRARHGDRPVGHRDRPGHRPQRAPRRLGPGRPARPPAGGARAGRTAVRRGARRQRQRLLGRPRRYRDHAASRTPPARRTLWAVYESPGRDGARRVEPAVRAQLERHGFATATHTEASGVLAISATRAEV
jgi:hypothetical protein